MKGIFSSISAFARFCERSEDFARFVRKKIADCSINPVIFNSESLGNKFFVIPVQMGIHTAMKQFYVYILASKRNGTLYIGVTNNLIRRVYEHKNDLIDGFTKKYDVHLLVYYEQYEDIENAIQREKRLKKWNRQWKIELIERDNPEWNDLYIQLI